METSNTTELLPGEIDALWHEEWIKNIEAEQHSIEEWYNG